MPSISRQELEEIIKTTVLPLIKDTGGSELKDLVDASVAKAMEPVRSQQIDWASRLLNAGEEKKHPARDKGQAFGRAVRAFALSKIEGRGFDGAVDYLKSWGDADIVKEIVNTREKALAAGLATAGGFLVPEQFSTDIIELRRAAVLVRRMGPREIPMPTGTVNVPKITGGSSATYIGENTNITKSQQAFGQVKLTWKKLAALVPISNDLLRYSSPGADSIVRDDVVRSMAVKEDSAFIRSDGTGGEPKGLRYWAASANILTVTAGGVSLANTTTDLGRLILRLKTNNVPMTRPGWLMSPRSEHYLMTVLNTNGVFVYRDEMLAGRLWGRPFGVSTSIPENLTVGSNSDTSEVYLVDFDDAVIGDSQRLIVDVSQEAAYHDGSSVVAAYSQDQTVVRAISEHDFAVRDANAVAVMTGVRWGV